MTEKIKASPKIERQICKMCEEDVPAVKYCTECCDWLCPNCTLAHRRVKLTKSHILSDHQSDKVKNIRMCPNHKNEPLKLYCEVKEQNFQWRYSRLLFRRAPFSLAEIASLSNIKITSLNIFNKQQKERNHS